MTPYETHPELRDVAVLLQANRDALDALVEQAARTVIAAVQENRRDLDRTKRKAGNLARQAAKENTRDLDAIMTPALATVANQVTENSVDLGLVQTRALLGEPSYEQRRATQTVAADEQPLRDGGDREGEGTGLPAANQAGESGGGDPARQGEAPEKVGGPFATTDYGPGWHPGPPILTATALPAPPLVISEPSITASYDPGFVIPEPGLTATLGPIGGMPTDGTCWVLRFQATVNLASHLPTWGKCDKYGDWFVCEVIFPTEEQAKDLLVALQSKFGENVIATWWIDKTGCPVTPAPTLPPLKPIPPLGTPTVCAQQLVTPMGGDTVQFFCKLDPGVIPGCQVTKVEDGSYSVTCKNVQSLSLSDLWKLSQCGPSFPCADGVGGPKPKPGDEGVVGDGVGGDDKCCPAVKCPAPVVKVEPVIRCPEPPDVVVNNYISMPGIGTPPPPPPPPPPAKAGCETETDPGQPARYWFDRCHLPIRAAAMAYLNVPEFAGVIPAPLMLIAKDRYKEALPAFIPVA